MISDDKHWKVDHFNHINCTKTALQMFFLYEEEFQITCTSEMVRLKGNTLFHLVQSSLFAKLTYVRHDLECIISAVIRSWSLLYLWSLPERSFKSLILKKVLIHSTDPLYPSTYPVLFVITNMPFQDSLNSIAYSIAQCERKIKSP